ncbi:N-acetylneuraminate 9-O-acetyltransferase isoform X2 [Daphnia magna]|nr:N-acetylneuraminate 9-O-acetyltransferase isoform X2 [Daphnia magna]
MAIVKLARLSHNELPVCKGNLLEQREYHYEGEKLGSFDSSRLMSKNGPCRLSKYTVERTCFDTIRENRPKKQLLHLVFIGDSRIRQQFFNFLRLIPDHDRKWQPSPIPPIYHGDIEVISDILSLKLSFQWRPLLDDTVIESIRHWSSPNDDTERPYLVFLSMVLWHIVRIHSQDEYNVYQHKLKVINPILGQLAKGSQVIWLNQYPMLTFYGGMPYGGVNDSDIILSEKAHRYNKDIRRIFGNHSSVRIWDSSNPLAEEYVRGCALFRRGHPGPPLFRDPDHSFIDCKDYIHTGYSALSLATQILFNDICNTQMENDL